MFAFAGMMKQCFVVFCHGQCRTGYERSQPRELTGVVVRRKHWSERKQIEPRLRQQRKRGCEKMRKTSRNTRSVHQERERHGNCICSFARSTLTLAVLFYFQDFVLLTFFLALVDVSFGNSCGIYQAEAAKREAAARRIAEQDAVEASRREESTREAVQRAEHRAVRLLLVRNDDGRTVLAMIRVSIVWSSCRFDYYDGGGENGGDGDVTSSTTAFMP